MPSLRWLVLGAGLLLASASRRAQERYQREQVAAGAIVGSVSGSGAFLAAGKLTRNVYPGGVTYRPFLQPLLSVQQRAALAAGVALASHALTIELAWRDNAVGNSLRRLGSVPLDAVGGVRNRIRDAEREREKARRKQWLRQKSKPARMLQQR